MTSWATGRPAAATCAAAASETGPAAPQTAGARRHFQLPPLPHNPVLDNPVCSSTLPCHPGPLHPCSRSVFSADDIFNFLCHCPALSAPPLINSSNFSCTNYSSMSSEISMRGGENRAYQGSLNSKCSWILVLPKGSCSSRPDLITCNLFVLVLFQEWHPPLVFVALRF